MAFYVVKLYNHHHHLHIQNWERKREIHMSLSTGYVGTVAHSTHGPSIIIFTWLCFPLTSLHYSVAPFCHSLHPCHLPHHISFHLLPSITLSSPSPLPFLPPPFPCPSPHPCSVINFSIVTFPLCFVYPHFLPTFCFSNVPPWHHQNPPPDPGSVWDWRAALQRNVQDSYWNW